MAHGHHDHKKTYLRVWLALLGLTVITVSVAYQDYGDLNIFIAMLIATIKASLVVLFFMHLKEDHRTNQVIFVGSFAFLVIFVGLTASDVFYRPNERAVAVVAAVQATGVSAQELEQLAQSTPQAIEAGKKAYVAQCSACHGTEGKGDGVAGKALNPPPRNFSVTDGWKQGRGPGQVFLTLSKGVPGSSMPAFGNTLSVQDRWAMTHYVRSVMPDQPQDPPDVAAQVKEAAGGGGDATAAARLPVAMAMELLAEAPREPSVRMDAVAIPGLEAGQSLYAHHCQSCHGGDGQGGIKVRTLGANPPAYLTAPTLVKGPRRNEWLDNTPNFIRIVSTGNPGRGKPAIAHFTDDQWHALHQYVQALAK